MQRTPRLRLGSNPSVSGAGSLIRDVRMSSKRMAFLLAAGIVACGLVAWGVKWVGRARSQSAYAGCTVYLRQIDSAKQGWALEYKKTTNDVPTWDDIRPHLDPHPGMNLPFELPKCPDGGVYTIGRVDERPSCSIGGPYHSLLP